MKLDCLRYIGAVAREVRSVIHEGRPARAVVASCAYDTSAEDLWDAITNPDRIPRWFMPVSGDLRLGGRYQLHGNASGQITNCEPPRSLRLTWEFGGEVTWVQVKLFQLTDGGTRLELEHTAVVSEDRWKQFGPGATGVGWDLTLMGLGQHLSTGASVDPQQAMAWTTSEEGRDFLRQSSDAWGQASVAAGTNEREARAAAARTAEFYTGACV